MNDHADRFRVVSLWVSLFSSLSIDGYAQVYSPTSVPDLTQPDFPVQTLSVGERPEPDYDQLGIVMGSFIVKPSILVGEDFDSNILGSQDFERSDFFTVVRPVVSIDSNWARDEVSFYAEGDIAQYARYTSENVGNLVVRADGRLDLAQGEILKAEASYQVEHESRYSPESQEAANLSGGGSYARYPTEYSLGNGLLSYVYSPSRLGFQIEATVNDYQFTNEPTLKGGLAIEGDRNRREYVVTPRVSYELTPGYQAFVEVWGNRRQYDSETDATPEHIRRGSTGYAGAFGSQINLGDVLNGEIYVGYQSQNYDDLRLRANDGIYLGGSLLWNVTQLTSLKLAVSRNIQETILPGSSGFWDTEVNVTAEHELLRNILLTATASYSSNAYEGIGRKDTTVSGGAGAKWRLTQIYSVEVSGNIQHRWSNRALNDYTRAIVAVDFKVAF